jgi:type VI secretion system protein
MTVAKLVCLLGVGALALSCAPVVRSARLQLQVSVSADVNQDRPIPVDLVFVWDKKTAAKVEALSAKDWFEKKRQYRQEDPNERTLTVREWEWVPGQAVPDLDMEVRPAARRWLQAIFVFANYRTEGPHRFRVAPGAASLQLLNEDASVQRVDLIEKAPLATKRN